MYLDTETTGLTPPRDRIVELAIIDESENILLNTLVNPEKHIPEMVIQIHGIDDDMVSQAPTFERLLPAVQKIIGGVGRVIIYNADFDTGFFPVDFWGDVQITCCMKEFVFVFQELEGYFSGKRFPLAKSFNISTGRHMGELGRPHRALTDCLACSSVWAWCQHKRKIIDDPGWKNNGYRVFCAVCQKKTFHKFRPRIREDLPKYYQCLECLENNVSVAEMESLLKQPKKTK